MTLKVNRETRKIGNYFLSWSRALAIYERTPDVVNDGAPVSAAAMPTGPPARSR